MSIADITRYGRALGDWSAIKNPANVPQRFLVNRPIGWAGGRVVGGSKKAFGMIGLVAVAEFFSGLSRSMKYNAARDIYFGSMASYAMWVDRGWTLPASGLDVPPYPFFSAAVEKKQSEMLGLGGFKPPYKMPSPGSSAKTKVRSGVYEGQKFLGDMGQFFRDASLGGLGGRFLRRTAGRQVSGFLFNSLKARQNPMYVFVKEVLKEAERNLDGKDNTGILRASLAMGLTLREFEDNSRKQILRAGSSAGLSDSYLETRIAGYRNTGKVDRGGELFTIKLSDIKK